MRALPRLNSRALWVFGWAVCVLTATLFPFDFRVGDGGPVGLYGFSTRELTDVVDILFNVILFLPLGASVHAAKRPGRCALVNSLVSAGFAGFLISSAVEYLQAYLPGRASSVVDIGWNTTGALIGVFGYAVAGPFVATRIAWMRSLESPALLAWALLAFTAVALVVSGLLQLQTRLSDWREYPLLLGNEYTGDRPWRGRILALEMTDAATPHEAVDAFSTGRSLRLPGTRLAAFDFVGDAPYRDAAGLLPSLDWSGDRLGSSSGEGVSLEGRSWLRTSGAAPTIAERVHQSNAFTLVVRCATDDLDQAGPARIVSNSRDVNNRNFTLGQSGSAAVFRLRTPHTGPNGSRPELVLPDAFSGDEWQQILVTYDGAVLLAAVAGTGRVSRIELSPGSSLVALGVTNFFTSYFDLPAATVRADELGTYKLTYVGVVSLLAGGLAGLIGESRRQRCAACLIWVLAFAPLLEVTLTLVSGRFFAWRSLADYVMVGALVSLASAVAVSAIVATLMPQDGGQVFG